MIEGVEIRTPPMDTVELDILARRIVCSPVRLREVVVRPPDFARALTHPRATHELLSPPHLRRLANVVGALTGETISLRRRPVFAGSYRYPEAREISSLLTYARADLAAVHPPLTAVGLSGLFALMVHPYADGNGRLCRTLWLHGLLRHGCTPTRAVTVVDMFYLPGPDSVLGVIHAAQCGELNDFICRWHSACQS